MAESNDFFEVRGLLLDGGAAVFCGAANPATALTDLPAGSLYLRFDGTIWTKTGALPNQWTLLSGSGGGTTTWGSITGTLSDQSDLWAALQSLITNLTYNATTRTLQSSSGDDVVLPLFTSLLAGLTPASGGGTANFLRADGTWVVPPTNLTYNEATRTIQSDTGTDATLPLFDSDTDGLTPASAGGTTNYLRADGQWQVPPTNLSYDAATRTVQSDTGNDATLPLFDTVNDGLVPNATGSKFDVLRADGTWDQPDGVQLYNGFQNQTDATLSYDSATRTVTLTQTGGVKYWYKGVEVTGAASISAQHDTAAGGKFFFFNSTTATFTVTTTPWSLEDDVTVCYVYYDGTKGVAWEERHHAWRDPKNHSYLHNTRGTFKASGAAISGYTLEDGTTDSKVQYALTSGVVYDEDIRVTIPALPAGGPYMVWYRTGSTWTFTTGLSVPYMTGATWIQYDNAGTLTELANEEYVNYYVFVTTALDSQYRTFLVAGQQKYDGLGDALYEQFPSLSFPGFPVLECAPIYRITFGANGAYLTTGLVQIENVVSIDRNYAPARFKLDYFDLSYKPAPGAPTAESARIYVTDIANRFLPSFRGPVGVTTALQPLMARNKTAIWNPPGNATTVPGVFGFNALATLGNVTARNVTTGTYLGRMKRLGLRSNTAGGSFAGGYSNVAQYTTGAANDLGGFFFVMRFGISDEFAFTDARMFVGMTASVVAPTNVEPSTLVNCLGVAQLSTDNTQLYVVGGGTVPQTPVALGTQLGAPAANLALEMAIFAPQGTPGTWYWRVTNIETGISRDGFWTGGSTVVPPVTVLLAQSAWRTNNTTVNQRVGLDICSIYMETDE